MLSQKTHHSSYNQIKLIDSCWEVSFHSWMVGVHYTFKVLKLVPLFMMSFRDFSTSPTHPGRPPYRTHAVVVMTLGWQLFTAQLEGSDLRSLEFPSHPRSFSCAKSACIYHMVNLLRWFATKKRNPQSNYSIYIQWVFYCCDLLNPEWSNQTLAEWTKSHNSQSDQAQTEIPKPSSLPGAVLFQIQRHRNWSHLGSLASKQCWWCMIRLRIKCLGEFDIIC